MLSDPSGTGRIASTKPNQGGEVLRAHHSPELESCKSESIAQLGLAALECLWAGVELGSRRVAGRGAVNCLRASLFVGRVGK